MPTTPNVPADSPWADGPGFQGPDGVRVEPRGSFAEPDFLASALRRFIAEHRPAEPATPSPSAWERCGDVYIRQIPDGSWELALASGRQQGTVYTFDSKEALLSQVEA